MNLFSKVAVAVCVALLGLVVCTGAAMADFEVTSFDVRTNGNEAGDPYAQAGGHPYLFTSHIEWANHPDPANVELDKPDGEVKDALVYLPPGFVGNPTVAPTCTAAQLAYLNQYGLFSPSDCPVSSQIGVIHNKFSFSDWEPGPGYTSPVFNMEPPTGKAARFGFKVAQTLVYIDAELVPDSAQPGGYAIVAGSRAIPEALQVDASDITFWGTPADPSHDKLRCNVGLFGFNAEEGCGAYPPDLGGGEFSSDAAAIPFLRQPTSCPPEGVGEKWTLNTASWESPGAIETADVFSHLAPFAPEAPGPQQGSDGCGVVPFKPKLAAAPTQQSTSSPSGLTVNLTIPTEGLVNPDGIAESDIQKAVVTLPEGVTINPSQADGLNVCTPAQYDSIEMSPETGCPSDSKIGSVQVHTPLINETIPGDVYVAKSYDNPFGSLLALYIVLREPQRGVLVKLAGKVETDQASGQITTTFEDLPQVPFSSFQFKFREGARAPLATPQACGTYETVAEFTPWSDPEKTVTSRSSFEIIHGVGGGPCPGGGLPPFKPGLIAGTINNRAGSYSPFDVRLFRTDEEQEMTHFSIKLPPGVTGKLAGMGYCSDAAIEEAKHKSGTEELANPSCPASSEVGRTLAGAGVGSVQTYAPGKIYYAGPYHGSVISIAAITAAKVGPFDLGTVVIRQALDINPETAEVFIDATGSDPIPHIIDGITTHIRDIRAYVDRDEFTLNPTSCERTSTASTVLGSGFDFASAADDEPVTVSTPFQAADCAALPFRPKLNLSLLGGTKRGDHPRFRSVLRMREGEANIARAQVTLPRSEFLENAHIKTICTRVQFKAGEVPGEGCPAGSVYGYAKAISPLLDYPIEGPVFLRSSEHQLPDLVAAMHGAQIDISVVGRVISTEGGGIRTTFESVPDAPVSKFILTMQGGKKGLLVNSTDLCRGSHRADVDFDAQNGKIKDMAPALRAKCANARKAKRAHKRAHR